MPLLCDVESWKDARTVRIDTSLNRDLVFDLEFERLQLDNKGKFTALSPNRLTDDLAAELSNNLAAYV